MLNRYPSIADLEARARERLPRFAWDYLAGAAGDETGLAHNRSSYDSVRFTPQYLCERRPVDTRTTLFGRGWAYPFAIAPIGQSGLIWPRSPEYLAAAAKRANIPYCLSMVATTGIERIGEIAGANAWFQLYPLRDLGVTRSVLERAKAAGFSALIVTVDTPAGRRTLRDQRNGLTVPPRLSLANIARMFGHPAWLAATAAAGMPRFETLLPYMPKDADMTGVAALTQTLLARGIDAKGLESVRALWDGPMMVKGPFGVQDARVCMDIGIEGLVLSNHGARQSESLPCPLHALPRIRDAAGEALCVGVDSGARSGLDVARALALGAQFVLLGRAFMFAVAALGERGARHACELLAMELEQAMGQIGCFELSKLPAHLAPEAAAAGGPKG
jgi:isopentenyl diphosphate isomerase/L-lactate dehydrogenase-like FMN-dependent dehydrogenase